MFHRFSFFALLSLTAFSLVACDDSDTSQNEPPSVVRGLKTVVVSDLERVVERKYPSILQPSAISVLSFEIPGKLKEVNLDVGQLVKKGEVLAELDPTTLEFQVQSAEAALRQAESSARTKQTDLDRQLSLLQKDVIAQAAADQAQNAADAALAELDRAKKDLDTARENLTKSVLKAPFDGIINSVSVDSFANVAGAAAVATVYSAERFETSFSVSFDVINRLTVGKQAVVRLADNPSIVLQGQVSEIGARADTVSSFPVVVSLNETAPGLKAGMAIEVSLSFPLDAGNGFLLPLSVLSLEGQVSGDPENDTAFVYIYEGETETVKRREIQIGGVRGNNIIVVSGVEPGERVASAGVSFLREGQKVKLLTSEDTE